MKIIKTRLLSEDPRWIFCWQFVYLHQKRNS